jgi:hypothetical protein
MKTVPNSEYFLPSIPNLDAGFPEHTNQLMNIVILNIALFIRLDLTILYRLKFVIITL